MVDLAKLEAASAEAAEVGGRLRAAFRGEGDAADELLCRVCKLALPAFASLASLTKLLGEEQLLVRLGRRGTPAGAETFGLYLTAGGRLLEDRCVYEGGAWRVVAVRPRPTKAAARDYDVETIAANLLRLCAGVVDGNAGKRTAEALARAERLRAAATLIEAISK